MSDNTKGLATLLRAFGERTTRVYDVPMFNPDALAFWLASHNVRVVPQGSAVVPREPSDAMIEAALKATWSTADRRGFAANVLRAALAAEEL
jgi:hypothetical protein